MYIAANDEFQIAATEDYEVIRVVHPLPESTDPSMALVQKAFEVSYSVAERLWEPYLPECMVPARIESTGTNGAEEYRVVVRGYHRKIDEFKKRKRHIHGVNKWKDFSTLVLQRYILLHYSSLYID
jgi:hypothetical protein